MNTKKFLIGSVTFDYPYAPHLFKIEMILAFGQGGQIQQSVLLELINIVKEIRLLPVPDLMGVTENQGIWQCYDMNGVLSYHDNQSEALKAASSEARKIMEELLKLLDTFSLFLKKNEEGPSEMALQGGFIEWQGSLTALNYLLNGLEKTGMVLPRSKNRIVKHFVDKNGQAIREGLSDLNKKAGRNPFKNDALKMLIDSLDEIDVQYKADSL